MAAKSSISRGLLFAVEFFSELYKLFKARGLSDDEMHRLIEKKFKTASGLAQAMMELILEGGKEPNFKNLKLVSNEIEIKADSFSKNSFFGNDRPTKLYFGSNFENWILGAMPEEIPAFQDQLFQVQLGRAMNDAQILAELGDSKPFEISEFVAIIRELISKQLKGEAGVLLNNGYANIFYVRDQNGVLRAVYVYWIDVGWYLNASSIESPRRWDGGHQVFSRLPVRQAGNS